MATKVNGKPDYERSTKKSISMPLMMFNRASIRARQQSLTTFSDYVQKLIREDLQEDGTTAIAA